ncbi:MAG: GyrI-like domain-containing protein [Planctomycetota bacterium]
MNCIRFHVVLAACSVLLVASCRSLTQSSYTSDPQGSDPEAQEVARRAAELAAYPPPNLQLDLPIAQAPFADVAVNWKQRGNQPYLYLDHIGDYRLAGPKIVDVFERMTEAEIPQFGPPFILFYDDPAETPTDELRARVAIPVNSRITTPPSGLSFDVLPQTVVVYSFIGGAYSEVPRAYPAMFEFLRKMRWALNGPIRETYLVSPASVASFDELVTEVQIPGTQAR